MASTTAFGEVSAQGRSASSGLLCAICVNRPATISVLVGKRRYRTCVSCGVKAPPGGARWVNDSLPRLRDRILLALRFNPGATALDLRIALELGDDQANTLGQHLSRMTRSGEVARVGHFPEYEYTLAPRRTA